MILPVMYQNLAILAAFAFFYSLTSGSLARTPVNGALVFTAFGVAMGPMGLGVLKLDVDAEGLRTLAELTLAMVLFTDAAAANLRVLQHSYRIPLRLLVIGLPLTIGLGYAAGLLLLGGLVFGAMERQGVHSRLLHAEGVGDALALFTWVVFGAVLVGPGLSALTWQLGLYAVLSLTVIRMVPVFLALTGSGLAFVEKLFVGWFGPRGMASIVFVLIVSGEKLAGGSTITNAAVATIVLSILLHCTSVNPLVAALTKRKKATAGRSD